MANLRNFKDRLKQWDSEFDIHQLFLTKKDFGIHDSKSYPKPLRKGEKVKLKLVLPGRFEAKDGQNREMLGKIKNRIVQVRYSSNKIGDTIRVQITKTKDNIFYGRQLR
jgi:uncharacterized Fe-S cluster-containing radical SAM superfamily enzyme